MIGIALQPALDLPIDAAVYGGHSRLLRQDASYTMLASKGLGALSTRPDPTTPVVLADLVNRDEVTGISCSFRKC